MTDFDTTNLAGLSFLELYRTEEPLRFIMHRIGITTQQSRDKIINDGYNSVESIVEMHPNDSEGFKKYLQTLNKTYATATTALQVYYSPKVIARFGALLFYYFQLVKGFHKIPDLSAVTTDFLEELLHIQKDIYSEVNKDSDDDEGKIDIPILKGTENWIDFRDKFELHLSEVKSKRGFPLDYLLDKTIREVNNIRSPYVEVDTIDLSVDGFYRSHATHIGSSYKIDNRDLWAKLKKLLLGTTNYNHISPHSTTKDGRKAWESLLNVYEGPDFAERQRELAFTKLMNTWYKGETNKFNFEKYTNIHKSAHKMLEDAGYNGGTGMDDSTKTQHFKSGIKSDAGLENALTTLRSQPGVYNTFTTVANFLKAEVEHKQIRRTQLRNTSTHHVSQVHKEKGRDTTFKTVGGKKLYAKSYSKQEFSAFTNEQRQAVITLNRERRQKFKGGKRPADTKRNNSGNNNGNRNVSSSTISNDDMTIIAEAVVAGVGRASQTNEGNDNVSSHTPPNSNQSIAEAGSIGSYIATQRKKKKAKRDEK